VLFQETQRAITRISRNAAGNPHKHWGGGVKNSCF
jgi:hypothetical protein